ncbi:5-oxoprolinase/urea amidolyase family protein [Humibacter sp. RRB41]|uniref:5-oxoprolinase subunit B/C family protein n=1 Tax=Humibacter sp. RRB41 TaxID=2919946 RepID=UPI001FAACCFB|nr:5-oxoprolinase/urea amidolyase family protein [Humibacter sp. RRB41]
MNADVGIRRLGDRALLADLPDLETVLAARDALAASRPHGVEDVVPAARTVAVLFDPQRVSLDAARTWFQRALGDLVGHGRPTSDPAGSEVVIDVVYDGEDLAEAARLVGVSVDELVRKHAAERWRVAFDGFAPGFGYLVADGDWFEVPRRSSPRTNVPAGAVALAGGFSGVYPREGPGGWQLIGRTDAPLWRPRSSPPALLAPGTAVRFRAVDALAPDSAAPAAAAAPAPPGPAAAASVAAAPSITVLRAGPQLLIEDLGRVGSASIGAGRSGALDRGALRLANRLVGNPEGAAGLEVVVGAELRFEQPTWFAVTGARGVLRVGGHPIESDAAVHADAGDVLSLGMADHGLRYVIALRGGVDAPLELASASTDLGARLGPAPLTDGDAIVIGAGTASGIPAVDALTVWSPPDDEVDVHVVPGPREDWFARDSVEAFYDTEWEVTQASNRVGMRLRSPRGVSLDRAERVAATELASEPMVPGAIQVPPSGEPTVLLADGPVTGGYPVIAVVTDADLDLFAQLRPGQRLRFRHAR